MRTIFGFIIGVLVTIGVAYFHDSTVIEPSGKIVNWDQASDFGRGMVEIVRNGFDRITGR